MGRWINHDPIGELGGLNLYGFVANAPLDRIDPLGLACAESYCSSPAPVPMGPEACPSAQDPAPQQPGPIPPGPADKSCDKVYGEGSCERFCKDGTPPCPKSAEKYPDAWGIACCPEAGKPGCKCVCTETASGPYPDAGQQVVDCVRAHEDQHLANCGQLPAGRNNECNAYTVTAQCVGGKAGSCGNGPKACKCLKQLFEFLKNQVNSGCEANCKGLGGKKYDCVSAMKEAWRQLHAASVKNKCTGGDAVPPPPKR
ncbi:MAG: hypothetical protein LC135_11030 [Phycisphaerae bacterium]|nr:hypothetical protein [Phycisphaerae bacterium]